MSEVIAKLTSNHIKVKGAEYVMDYPHGEWIETSEGTMCSNCHKFPYDDGEYHIVNWYSDFCPNCGADMREREGE